MWRLIRGRSYVLTWRRHHVGQLSVSFHVRHDSRYVQVDNQFEIQQNRLNHVDSPTLRPRHMKCWATRTEAHEMLDQKKSSKMIYSQPKTFLYFAPPCFGNSSLNYQRLFLKISTAQLDSHPLCAIHQARGVLPRFVGSSRWEEDRAHCAHCTLIGKL